MLRLHQDDRLSAEGRWVLSSAERLVLVPDEIRKCVGFAARDAGVGRRVGGTVFIASLPYAEGRSVRFAVTAAHNLDKAAERAVDDRLHLRFNRRGGGFEWVETTFGDWIRHPSRPGEVDCAVIPLPLPDTADTLAYPLTDPPKTNWLTAEAITSLGVGVGDDVFFPGLFIKHAGEEQNVPIIRTGTIAAMLTRGVATEFGPINAYLVEARSIGGLSGSPVFVQIPRQTPWAMEGTKPKRLEPFIFFMGLVHGHFDVELFADSDSATADGLSDKAVNMGIAVVVPAQDVMEVLHQPRVTAILEVERQRFDDINNATPDFNQ